ncbi:metallophosphoesterase [Actinoplanes sp. NPDC020271]|uniref:metallophosphoesterase n=1 Tax=Actinoplanes sp. NPDC020271 TaxID=3363896 RepID=UPI0037A192B7
MGRIVVVGDVGGCAEQLERVVLPLAEDPGTTVVQVGDLVDRGPDSPGVLRLVEQRLRAGRWVQLIGNHEAQYLGGPRFWPQPLSDADAALLRGWWLREWLRVAAAVRTADGEELLLVHAGLTVDVWRQLGEPVTAGTAADLLNTRPEPLLWGFDGPLWAEAASQLYPSWLSGVRSLPFSQVHGHSTVVRFEAREWACEERIRARTSVDWQARHTVTRCPGGRFVGVDPKHGTAGAPRWAPLVLEGAALIA